MFIANDKDKKFAETRGFYKKMLTASHLPNISKH